MSPLAHIKSTYLVIVFLSLITLTPSSLAVTSAACPGEKGYLFTNYRSHATRNPTKGGFVSDSALVEDSAYIAPTAAVCGSASVLEHARIYGKAVISGEAEVTNKARVFGNARVFGTAYIGGEAKVSDHAQVSGDAVVEGVAWVRGYAEINRGVITEGIKKAVKPQSVIEAEKRAAEQAAIRKAEEKKHLQLIALKDKANASMKSIAGLLRTGDYKSKNYNRRVVTAYEWSVSDTHPRHCTIEMNLDSSQKGMTDGRSLNRDRSSYHTINLNNYSFKVNNEDSTYVSPTYCMHNQGYNNSYSFCFSSWSKREEVLKKMKYHSDNYCRLWK